MGFCTRRCTIMESNKKKVTRLRPKTSPATFDSGYSIETNVLPVRA